MQDKIREFVKDLRDHYDDSYWWADHPALQQAAVSVVGGGLFLLIVYLRLKIERRYRYA